jgi:D-xylose 1-dehydrogenase (NADP+, D-xylono-1,5-lactone-forming)
MNKMRFGILGAARIAAGALIPAIKKSDNAEVVAVAARDAERAKAYAAEHGIPKAYGNYDEMLADPNIDAVYNPLPNSEHAPLSIRALEAGKHVLCEKSFTLSAAEAMQVDATAKRVGRQVMEAFMYRFHPQIQHAKDLITNGAIGELRLIRPTFSFSLDRPTDIRWVKALGGGALYDIGTYCVNVSRTLAGAEPVRVWGTSLLTPEDHSGGGGTDSSFLGILDFGGELRSSFDCSFDQTFRQRVELVGTKGTLVLPDPFVPGRDTKGKDSGHGWAAPSLVLNGETVASVAADQYQLMVEHFVRAARGEEALRYPAEEAVRQMKVLDALFESAKLGQWVKV